MLKDVYLFEGLPEEELAAIDRHAVTKHYRKHTVIIEKDIEVLTVDGVKMEFLNTPFTEAPSEMHTWFPDTKVFWSAENVTGTFHNIYTLRGALVRDALEWSKQLKAACA